MVRFANADAAQLDLPIVARDGGIAVRALAYDGNQRVSGRDAFGAYFQLEHEGKERARVGVLFSGTFEYLDPTRLGYPEGGDTQSLLLECALAAIGEYLDDVGLPPESPPGSPATGVQCFSGQYEAWTKRKAATDGEVLGYLNGKAYWAWRLGCPNARITFADALRLGTRIANLRRVATLGDGKEWSISNESAFGFSMVATPELLRSQSALVDKPKASDVTPLSALLATPRYDGVAAHWNRAHEYAHGPHRDLANAAKEAICAVEALARVVTGRHSDTLGELIKVLKGSYGLNPAIAKSLEGVWGFTNTWPGIRHGAPVANDLSKDDARFVLDSSDAAIRLLLAIDRGSGAPPV